MFHHGNESILWIERQFLSPHILLNIHFFVGHYPLLVFEVQKILDGVTHFVSKETQQLRTHGSTMRNGNNGVYEGRKKDYSHEGASCTVYARTEATGINNLIRRLSGKSWWLDFEPVFSGRSAEWMNGRRSTRIWKWDNRIILEQICKRWDRIFFQ